MFGFLKVVQPVIKPNTLSGALFLGSEKYMQARGTFREGEKMCALMVAYTVAFGCPKWMGDDNKPEPVVPFSQFWRESSFLKKVGFVLFVPPVLTVLAGGFGFFMTRLKLHYRVPYTTLWGVMFKNDEGRSFHNIAIELRARGY